MITYHSNCTAYQILYQMDGGIPQRRENRTMDMLHAVDWKNMETAVTRVYKASKTKLRAGL